MATDILLMEGFGYMPDGAIASGTDTELLGNVWSSFTNTFKMTDRGDGRKWIERNTSDAEYVLQSYSWTGVTTIWVACTVKFTQAASRYVNLCALYDGTTLMGNLGFDPLGKPLYTTDENRSFDDSRRYTGSALTMMSEHHVEFKIVLHNSTGTVEVWVDGVSQGEETGLDTISGGTSCDNVRFFNSGHPLGDYYCIDQGWSFSDLVVHKRSTRLGPCGVFYQEVENDGSNTDFTPSSGTDHYAMVDDVGASGSDEDSTYNESDGTSGHKDDFGFSTTVTCDNVFSVGTHTRCRKDGVGSSSVKVGVGHSTAEDQSSGIALTESYENCEHWTDTNPSSASAWDDAELDDVIPSVEVV